MSYLHFGKNTNLFEFMKLAFETGESCVLDGLADEELKLVLTARFKVLNYPQNAGDFEMVFNKKCGVRITNAVNLHNPSVIYDKIAILKLHKCDNVFLKDLLQCNVKTLMFHNLQPFGFVWSQIWKNSAVQHVTFHGQLANCVPFSCTDLFFRLDSDTELDQQRRKIKTFTLLAKGSYSTVSLFISYLQKWDFAEKTIMYFEQEGLLDKQLISLLEIKSLRFLKAVVSIHRSSLEEEKEAFSTLQLAFKNNKTLVGANIDTLGNYLHTPNPSTPSRCYFNMFFERNKKIVLSHRLVELIIVLHCIDLPAYVLLWILDNLFEFCFYNENLKIIVIQKTMESIRQLKQV